MIGDKWKRIGNFVIRRNWICVYKGIVERLYFG